MNKKTYLRPDCRLVEIEPASLLDTSVTAPDAGWAEMPRRSVGFSRDRFDTYEEDFFDEDFI